MIDIESQVFTRIATDLREAFPGIMVESTLTLMPETFPTVCIEEADNSTFRRTIDSGAGDRYADVMYEVNIYSNKLDDGKLECKHIHEVIDATMVRMGFVRRGRYPVPVNRPMTYRLVARYSAVVSENEEIYRR